MTLHQKGTPISLNLSRSGAKVKMMEAKTSQLRKDITGLEEKLAQSDAEVKSLESEEEFKQSKIKETKAEPTSLAEAKGCLDKKLEKA